MANCCQVCGTEARPAVQKVWTQESFVARDKVGKAFFFTLYLCKKCTAYVKSLGDVRGFLEKRLPNDVVVTQKPPGPKSPVLTPRRGATSKGSTRRPP